MGLRTEIQMQYNHGEHSRKDTHADKEYEIYHYKHIAQIPCLT